MRDVRIKISEIQRWVAGELSSLHYESAGLVLYQISSKSQQKTGKKGQAARPSVALAKEGTKSKERGNPTQK